MKNKYFLILFLLSIFTFSTYSQDKIKLNDELFISKLDKNIYVVTHSFPWASNSMIILTSNDEVILIDTPYENDATELMMNWINKELKPKKITTIITGFHIDNLGGVEYLLSQKIPVYGADLTIKMIEERGEKTRKQTLSWLLKPEQKRYYDVYASIKFEKPNHIYKIEKGLNLKIGNIKFEVYYPGPSHSPDNVVVYMPSMKLLFGGCMIKSLESKDLGFTGDADLKEWPLSVQKVKNKYKTAKIVIPHHGNWGDMELIEHTLKLCNK
jgi:metallo-beta-lactamase class B